MSKTFGFIITGNKTATVEAKSLEEAEAKLDEYMSTEGDLADWEIMEQDPEYLDTVDIEV